MAALVLHLQAEAEIDLFAGLQSVGQARVMFDLPAARIGVDAERRVDQGSVLLQQPIYPVGVSAAFLVRGQCQNEVALWLEALLPETDQVRH